MWYRKDEWEKMKPGEAEVYLKAANLDCGVY